MSVHHVICGAPDPLDQRYVCSKDEGHGGEHEDTRYGRTWRKA